MDILEIEDVLKGLPDQALKQEAQQPSGQVPQYMVVSEIQRRSKMRKRFEAQKEQPSTTVAEQILTGGVASVAPPPPQMMGAMGMPQQTPAPQQQPPMQPQQMPPQQPPMPQQGAPMPLPVQMQAGGQLPYAGQPAGQAENIRDLLLQFSEEDLIQQMPFLEDAIREVARINRSGVEAYDVPVVESVPSAAPTIDTGIKSLLFNQPVVSKGFEKRTPQQEAITNFFKLTPEQEAGLRGGRIAMEAPGRLQSQTVRNFFMPEEQTSSESIDKLINQTAFVPTGSSDIDDLINQVDQIVVDPKQSAATQSDSAKLNLDTATKSDAPLLNMALSEKSLTDYGYSDTSMPALPEGIVLPKPKGTPDIQTQGIKYVSPDFPELVAPSFANMISEQERRLAKIREDAKRDVGAQALINLGAGVMEGDVSGGLRRAGEAASKVRTAERAAESDIANMQARIKMAEEQGKFDVAKALRAEQVQLYRDSTKAAADESQFVRTLGLSKQKLLAEVEKEAGVDARAKLAAAISIMEQELNPEKKQRMIERIAIQYLPMLSQGVVAGDQSVGTQGNQNRPPLSSFGG